MDKNTENEFTLRRLNLVGTHTVYNGMRVVLG